MKHLFQSATVIFLSIILTFCSCKKDRSCESCKTNKAPLAIAGPDQTIALPTDSIFLDGSASNDPDGRISEWQWTKILGSSFFVFKNAGNAKTQVTNLKEGIYLFELKVTDEDGLIAKDTIKVTVNSPASNPQVDVYVSGQQEGRAHYWKNGIAVNLPNGTMANSIYVSGNDVYLAGQEYLGGGIHQIAKYWKNGISINLTDSISYAGANDIYVYGNDTYVAGWESVGIPYAKYWKNGTAVHLPNGGFATSIYVLNNDVFVAGIDTGQTIAKYWKNGVGINLNTNGSDYSIANDIYVSGNDVFVAGALGEIIDYGDGYMELILHSAVYWKNGIPVNLPHGTRANSIYVSGNDVYVAGQEYNGNSLLAKYWKNGIPVNLPHGTQANSIYASGNDVYVAGDNNGKAKYWKNGLEVLLSNGPGQTWATNIVVMPR